jgi:hypothetical protein
VGGFKTAVVSRPPYHSTVATVLNCIKHFGDIPFPVKHVDDASVRSTDALHRRQSFHPTIRFLVLKGALAGCFSGGSLPLFALLWSFIARRFGFGLPIPQFLPQQT